MWQLLCVHRCSPDVFVYKWMRYCNSRHVTVSQQPQTMCRIKLIFYCSWLLHVLSFGIFALELGWKVGCKPIYISAGRNYTYVNVHWPSSNACGGLNCTAIDIYYQFIISFGLITRLVSRSCSPMVDSSNPDPGRNALLKLCTVIRSWVSDSSRVYDWVFVGHEYKMQCRISGSSPNLCLFQISVYEESDVLVAISRTQLQSWKLFFGILEVSNYKYYLPRLCIVL